MIPRLSRRLSCLALLPALSCLALGCEREKEPTPPAIADRYHALVDTLSMENPGSSTDALRSFLVESRRYTVADSVQLQLQRFNAASEGRYRTARELAREGDFDRAEAMLQDLALLPDNEDGKSARQHLEFEFYMEKARWLLVHQRFDEAGDVARTLQARHLSGFQRDEADKILDYTGLANDAMQMSARQSTRAACKQIIVLFASFYVDDGQYPGTFSIADLERFDPYSAKSIARSITAIEDYRASQDHYSMVAVGKDGSRYHIEDGELKD